MFDSAVSIMKIARVCELEVPNNDFENISFLHLFFMETNKHRKPNQNWHFA